MSKVKILLLATAALSVGMVTEAIAQPKTYTQGIAAKQPRAVKISARENAAVSTDERQILAKLKAVVIVSSPKDINANGANASGVTIRGENVPDAVANAAAAYVGAAVSPASLDRMTRDMVLAYRAVGLPVVNIVVPPQDVTNGVVQVVAVVGHMGRLTVEGNPSNPDYYTEGFGLASGDVIEESAVVEQLRWKSRRMNRRVDAIYSPGASYGLTDIAFDVKETKPWSVFAGADNTGSGGVGDYRFYAGFVASDLWKLDHELSYQFTTSEKGFDNLAAHAGTYTMPVYHRTDFQLSGSYVESETVTGPGTSNGKSWQLGGKFMSQLPRLQTVSLDAHYGFEYKNSDNTFEFGGAGAAGNTTEIAQFFGQILGQRGSAKSNTSFDLGFWAAPGGLFADNDNAAFDASRSDAKAAYIYGRANIDHTWFLPSDFMLNAKLEGQLSGSRLHPSEMMYLGGMNSVRGFDENAVRGDNGAFARVQLYSPAASLDRKSKADALRAYAFFDAGTVDVISATATEGNATIAGAGVGLSYQYNQNLTADLAYGWRVKSDNLVADKHDGELHFRVMARF